jgi:hypothetical protein
VPGRPDEHEAKRLLAGHGLRVPDSLCVAAGGPGSNVTPRDRGSGEWWVLRDRGEGPVAPGDSGTSGAEARGDLPAGADGPTGSQLPGTGDIQALDGFLCPNGELLQSLWRSNQGFFRYVPMKPDYTPDWGQATAWSAPISLAGLPGSGDIQTLSGFVMPNKQLMQAFWRSDQGFYRVVPMKADATPDWSNAGAWGGPVALAGMPGSGSMQAQSDFVMPNGQLMQAFWRGDQGFYRVVPMKADGTPDWDKAGAWGGPVLLGGLPGSGSLQAQSDVVLKNGQLLQTIWRGNQGWTRSVPMKTDQTPDWGAASAWAGPILP